MSTGLSVYSTFDSRLENKICPVYLFNYYFINEDGDKEKLFLSEDGAGTVLENTHSTWEFKNFGLIIEAEIILSNPDFLFGINGLVNDKAIIGVALQIASKKSAQQIIRPIGEIKKGEGSNTIITFVQELSKEMFYGNFCIKVLLYVKEASAELTFGKANIPGMMLGTVIEQLIDVDGNMSALPIIKINDPTKPLWSVEYNIDDATINSFDTDHVCIYFNSAHPAFRYLEKRDSQVGTFLQNEVMASALTLIIIHVKSLPEWDYIEQGENLEEGSIGAAIYYFIKTFDWNFQSAELLSESIRAYFETLGEDQYE